MSVLSHLAPALLQTFLTILVGYVFGRFKLVPADGVRAMGTFVTMLALPALLLRNMILLDLHHVPLRFFCAILLGKMVLFVFTVVVCVARHGWRSRRGLSDAGCFGIFVTQSNDFAMGLPILAALFSSDPATASFPALLYVIAPINLVIINPIAFFLMELGREPVEAPDAHHQHLKQGEAHPALEAAHTGAGHSPASGALASPTTAAADAEVAVVNPRLGSPDGSGSGGSVDGHHSRRPLLSQGSSGGRSGGSSGLSYKPLSLLDDGEASFGTVRPASAGHHLALPMPSVDAILNAPDSDSDRSGFSHSGSESDTDDVFASPSQQSHPHGHGHHRRREVRRRHQPRDGRSPSGGGGMRRKHRHRRDSAEGGRSRDAHEELPLHMAPDGATFSFLSAPSGLAAASTGRKKHAHHPRKGAHAHAHHGRGSAPPGGAVRSSGGASSTGAVVGSDGSVNGSASASASPDAIVVSLSVFPATGGGGGVDSSIPESSLSASLLAKGGGPGYLSSSPSFSSSPSASASASASGSPSLSPSSAPASAAVVVPPPSPSTLRLLLHIGGKVLSNPVVVCSILGIAANFALGGKVPEIIDGFLAALGNTFSALALFILGVNMQGKLALFGDRRKLSVPLLLILGKSLALPVIIRLLTQALGIPGEDPITVAAFLIGTFPTAPSAHFFAVDSNAHSKELIAPAMVLGTFIAAPLMAVSAQMATTTPSTDEVETIVSVSTRAAAAFGFVAAVYCVAVFAYNKRWRECDTRTRLLLTLCGLQALYTASVQFCPMDLESTPRVAALRFWAVLGSQFGVYVWTGLMGANEVVRRYHGTRAERALWPWYNLLGLAVVLLAVGGAALFGSHPTPMADIPFCACWNRYGKTQWGVTIALLASCLLATCVALVWSRGDAALDPAASPDTQPHIEIDLGSGGVRTGTGSVGNGEGWGIRASLLANSPMPAGGGGLGDGRRSSRSVLPSSRGSPAAFAEEDDARFDPPPQQQSPLLRPVPSRSACPLQNGTPPSPALTPAATATGENGSSSCPYATAPAGTSVGSGADGGTASLGSTPPPRFRTPCDAPVPQPPAPFMRPPPASNSRAAPLDPADEALAPTAVVAVTAADGAPSVPVTATDAENFWLFAMRVYLLGMSCSMFLTLALYTWSADTNGTRIEMQLLDAVLFGSAACYTCALFAAIKSLRSPLGPLKRCIRRRAKALTH